MSEVQELFSVLLQGTSVRLLDVGARRGVGHRFLPIAAYTDVIGFEPDERECSRLQREATSGTYHPWRNINYLPIALGARKKERPFFILRYENLSSLLRPNLKLLSTLSDTNPSRWEIKEVRPVETIPLDEAQDICGLPVNDADFLKVDTQGSELEILQSGRNRVLDSLIGVEVEVEFMEVYEGQPLFSDVDAFLRGEGFDLYCLDRFFAGPYRGYSARQICWTNAVYLKKTRAMWHRSDKIEKLRKLVSAALLYGLGEPSLRLLSECGSWLSGGEIDKLTSLIESSFCTRRDRFRWRLSMLKDALSLFLDPSISNRFQLAHKALRVDGPGGITWKVLPPGL